MLDKGILNEQGDIMDLESYSRMLLMLDVAPLGMGFFDRNLNMLDCNQEAARIFGFSEKEEYMANVWKTMPTSQPDGSNTRDAYIQGIMKAFLNGEYKCDLIRKRETGELFPTTSTFVRVPYKKDFVVLCYTTDMLDITMAKQREEEASTMARLMLDATPMAVFLMRTDFTAIDCNQEAIDLFGFDDKEQALENYHKIFPETNGRPYNLTDLNWLEESGIQNFEFEHQTIYGDPLPCNVTLVSLTLQDGQKTAACYLQDLRAMRAMAEELTRVELVEKESKAKSNFLARMSHEIRTPLNAILGTADIQLQKNGHSPEVEEAFIQIQNSSSLLMNIIRDILDLSRVEQGKLPIEPEEYDTESLISTSVQLNLMQLGSKKIRFNISADSALPKTMFGDQTRIRQVLNNLLSNAFKYTQQGEVQAVFKASNSRELELEDDEIGFFISVSDTGRGMSQEQIDTLLSNEYIRFYESTDRSIEGTGLGMAITRQLISLMGGKLKIKSEEGKGTTVEIIIPQKQVSQEWIGNQGAARIENMEITRETFGKAENMVYENMPYGSVLVVDDVESNLYVARGKLMPYNIKVETVESGYEAIEKIKSGNVYDIIFMDHMMPDMDGIDTTKIIQGLGYTNPIVALTANVIRGQAELFTRNGFAGFIAKPIDTHHLNSYLLRFVRDKYPAEIVEAAGKNTDYIAPNTVSPSLVEAFLRDASHTIKTLELTIKTQIKQEDMKIYTISAHSIKSALANIGATTLSDEAGHLELAGHKGDIYRIMAETPSFLSRLKDLAATLKAQGISDESPDAENVPLLLEKMQNFLNALKKFDKKGAKRIIEELKELSANPETKELLQQLSVHLLHSEFEEAEDAIKTAMQRYK